MTRLRFQPEGGALATADAEGDEGAGLFFFMELGKGGLDEAGASGSNGVAEGDGTAALVEDFWRDFAESLGEASLDGVFFFFEGFEAGESLRGEGFVDFDEIGVGEAEASAFVGGGGRLHGAESHAFGVAASVSVVDEPPDRGETVSFGGFFGADEEGYRAVGDLRGVASGDGAGIFFKNGTQAGQFFGRGICARPVVLRDGFSSDMEWGDFGGARFGLGEGFLVRKSGEGVLLFARNVKFTSENFGGLAHVEARNGIAEADLKADNGMEKFVGAQRGEGFEFVRKRFGAAELGQFFSRFWII